MGRKIFAWLRKDLLIKILSVIFAVILWTYVMAVENPPTDKRVEKVPVRFAAEDQLLAKDLIVRGDRSALLPEVSVLLSIERSNYASITADALSATVSLAGIVSPGTYRLRINTTTPRGDIISTSPAEVTLEIDQLTTKTVPIHLETEGGLPQGYWSGKPELTPSAVQIRGALNDIERVRQGVCTINLNDLTRSYNDTLLVELRDENNEVIEKSVLLGDQPSVIVKMDVLPKKTVGFDWESAISGSDKLPKGFEINHVRVTPATMDVVGEASVLAELQKLSLDAFSVQNATENLVIKVKIKVPEGVALLGEDEVEVVVDISEQIKSVNFAAVPVEISGLGRGLVATINEDYADITASGRVSLIDQFTRADVKLLADVTGLPEGEHKIDINGKIIPKELSDITLAMAPAQVTVTIRKK